MAFGQPEFYAKKDGNEGEEGPNPAYDDDKDWRREVFEWVAEGVDEDTKTK